MLLAACTQSASPPDQSQLPSGSFGLGADANNAAVDIAQYDWADTGRTYGRAAEGARAVALIDYLAGILAASSGVAAGVGPDMLQARREVRAAVGIAPDAPSQAVVDSLARVFTAAGTGDTRAALTALGAPFYTLGPRVTLQRLGNLPYVRTADIAATRAEQAMSGVGPNETD